MPRGNTFLQNVYIADGFADDCDELIHRCLKVDFLRFATFCEIWKDMQLSCMYQGRTSGAEIAELSEEVLHVSKHYMVSNTENFEESIAGLFLVYTLLNLQPYPGFASLRIVQEDLPAINRIARVARREKRYDVLYVLGAVLTKHTEYHAAARERGMEYPIRKYLEGHATIDRLGVRPKGVFFRQNEELDLIRELGGLELRYEAAKTAITGTLKPDRNLNYMNTNLAKEMGDTLKNLISGIVDDSDGDDEESQEEMVHSIKQKAMKSKVKPMQHLVTVNTSNTSRSTKPRQIKSDIAASPSKVKTSSPTKPLATNTPRKRKNIPQRKKQPTPKRNKRISRIFFENNDEDEDSNLPLSEETTDSELSDSPTMTNDDSTQESASQEQEIDIEIESLPCFIRSEQSGQLFEIEIIDKLKAAAARDRRENVSELPGADVTIKKMSKNYKKSVPGNVAASTSDEMAEILKVKAEKQKETVKSVKEPTFGEVVPKKIRKNRHLKSKLTRLGMLEVADMTPK